MTAPMTLTYGVAIAVPEPHGSHLRGCRAEFGDPQAASVPTHVTLVPPTETDEAGLADVCEALSDAVCGTASFDMALNGTGTFRPVSPVVFVAVSKGIAETERLAEAVRERLQVEQPRFPFHPHVTVAQEVAEPALDRAYDELADFRCEFTVDAVCLYVHEDGAGWTPRHSFPLS